MILALRDTFLIRLHFFPQLQGFQQQALADAVVAYALNIDNLGALEGAVKQVQHTIIIVYMGQVIRGDIKIVRHLIMSICLNLSESQCTK